MKMIITEKQLKNILGKKKEIDEEDTKSASSDSSSSSTSSSTSSASTSFSPAGASPTSTSGPSSTGAEGKGQMDFPPYPEVGHWESGVTRGPANPIGNAPMEDRVKRGKANPLR